MAVFCVTGASGFIGSEIVATLLAEGHTVRGTVRDSSMPYEYLRGLPGADERLSLHDADLLVDGSFDAAVQGCDYVLHVASPLEVTVDDPERALLAPAVEGVRSVLRSCLDVAGLRRVVVTSSLAALTDEGRDGHLFDERDWNTTSSLTRNPYWFSKVRAERAAWAFVEEHEPPWDVVAVNPGFVVGAGRNPALNPNNQMLRDVADGVGPAIIALEFPLADVRDVAEAHVRAAVTETANGRFLIVAETRSVRQIAELIRATYPTNRVPSLALDNAVGSWLVRSLVWRTMPSGQGMFVRTHVGHELRVDNSRSQEVLGLEYRDVDRSIIDAIDAMIATGHVTRTSR